MTCRLTRYGAHMERNARNDLPLLIGSVVGMVVAGLIIFVSVDISMQDESIDSNSPNAVTPGPASSFEVR